MVRTGVLLHSRQVLNLHSIENECFEVRPKGIFKNGILIHQTDLLVVGSCLVNNTIALKLVNGSVFMPSELKIGAKIITSREDICDFSKVGGITATECGTYLVCQTTNESLMLYQGRDMAPVAMIRDIKVVNKIHCPLQLSLKDSVLVVWQLYPVNTRNGVDVQLLVKIFDVGNWFECKQFNFTVKTVQKIINLSLVVKNNVVLMSVNGEVMFITLNSIIIGDLSPKLLAEDGKIGVAKLDEIIPFVFVNGEVFQFLFNKLKKVDCVVPEFKSTWREFVVKSTTKSFELVPKYTYDGVIKDCVLDTRKSHQTAVITLGFNTIETSIMGRWIKYMGRASLNIPISTILYEPSLELMLVTTIADKTRLIGDINLGVPLEIEGRALACKLIGEELQLAFSDRIEYYARMDNGFTLSHTNMHANVMSACYVEELGMVLHYIDKVEAGGKTLLADAFVSFVHYNENLSELVIGYSQPKQEPMAEYLEVSNLNIEPGYATVINVKTGTSKSYKFDAVPEALYKFNDDNMVAVFNSTNSIFRFQLKDNWKVSEYAVSSLVKLGVATSDYAVFYGFGLHQVSSSGEYSFVCDRFKKSSSLISGMISMTRGELLACVTKNEIRMFEYDTPGARSTDILVKQERFPALEPDLFLNHHYRILHIPSLRILVMYRGTVCNFYDSNTMETLITSGFSMRSCSSMTLWNFTLNDQKYEHMVVTDFSGTVASYTLKRQKNKVDCHVRFRAIAYNDADNDTSFSDMVCFCGNNMVIVRCQTTERNHTERRVSLLDPSQGKPIKSFVTDVESLSSILEKYVIICGTNNITIRDSDLSVLSVVSPGRNFEYLFGNMNILTHAAGAFSDPLTGKCRIVILCILRTVSGGFKPIEAGLNHHMAIYEFNQETDTLNFILMDPLARLQYDAPEGTIAPIPSYDNLDWQSRNHVEFYYHSTSQEVQTFKYPF